MERDWAKLVTDSECKSRSSNSARSLMLSSIDAWTPAKLPKLLIVWTFDKLSSNRFPSPSRPGKLSKARDLEARVESFEVFLVPTGGNWIVPWVSELDHAQIVKTYWTEENMAELAGEVGRLNAIYHDRPITLQSSFKNGRYLRLQYGINDYRRLPRCPSELDSLVGRHLEGLLNCRIRLRKDHSIHGGPSGWFDNSIARWENETQIKDAGQLYMQYADGELEHFPDFREGRQDFWTGFAIDHIMGRVLPGFTDAGGHAVGSDHTIDFREM